MNIRKYLKTIDLTDNNVLIQTRISQTMADSLKKIAKENRWKRPEMIRAMIQSLIDSEKKKRK